MTDVFQDSLFDTAPAHARGPIQSQQTLDSLGHDDSLKRWIARGVLYCSRRFASVTEAPTHDSHYVYDKPVTDDDILAYVESRTGRRQQRNVIARTRGLMLTAGWFLPAPDVIGRTGRRTKTVIPAACLLAELGDPA